MYKAYDEEEGIEVAWCRIAMDRVGEQEKQQIYKEVEILMSSSTKTFLHFTTFQPPDSANQIVFITEIMTSGTLKQ